MRFPGNCLLVALICAPVGQIRTMRNRTSRLHWYWLDASGRAFEFYVKGASRRSYMNNAISLGEIKRAPSLDEITCTAV